MKPLQLRPCHVLFLTIFYFTPERTAAQCDQWILHGEHEVCCQRCTLGCRLVKQCGRNVTKLCTPCEPNTYTRHPLKANCDKCTQCSDPRIQLKACSISEDTVCGCKPGYRCGNNKCDFCVLQCKEGEEPNDKRGCRKCPRGTYNDKMHSPCQRWNTSCPDGEVIIAQGTERSNIKCSKTAASTLPSPKENITPKTSENRIPDDDFTYLVIVFPAIAVFIIFIIFIIWKCHKKIQNQSKSKEETPVTPTQGELTIMIVDHEEACSFHQPEQEQGGSSESISTQGSETKLIV